METFKLIAIIWMSLLSQGIQECACRLDVSGLPNQRDASGFVSVAETDFNVTLFSFTVNSDNPPINVVPAKNSRFITIQNTTNVNSHVVSYNVSNAIPIDYDKDTGGQPQFKISIQVTDDSGNGKFVSMDIYVQDINDNPPRFLKEPYSWEVKERNGSKSYSCVNAIDEDSSVNGQVRYSWKPVAQSEETRQNYNKTFRINETSGEVDLIGVLDYETNNYYQFNITAKDSGNPSKETHAPIIIRVLDVQDTPPFFTSDSYRANVKEDIQVGLSVLTVSARDGDPGVSNDVNYTVMPGNGCENFFRINSFGVITTKKQLDRDNGTIYKLKGECSLIIKADEIESHPPQYGNTSVSTVVTIFVQDVDDNDPEFSDTSYIGYLNENPSLEMPVTNLSINVKDKDQGRNADMEIKVLYRNDTPCDIFKPSRPSVNGEANITLLVSGRHDALFDYETTKFIELKISVKSASNKTRRSTVNVTSTANVTIRIQNVNDNDPEFQPSNYTFAIDENSTNGTDVGDVNASDQDGDTLTYSLSGGMNRFHIDPSTGNITTNCRPKDLDRERIDQYYATLTVTDQGGRSRSVPAVIILNDIDDNAPLFAQSSQKIYIDENSNEYNMNSTYNLTTTDADLRETPSWYRNYSIVSCSPPDFQPNITVDTKDNITGLLWLNAPIDFEALQINVTGDQRIINVEIKATDFGASPQSSKTDLQFIVRDVNDNTPSFNPTSYKANITEDRTSSADNYTVVGSVHASDDDGTKRNSLVNYFILAGASDRFIINASSGEVKLQLNAKLDRETTPSYNLTIAAIDQGSPPRTGTTSMKVTIIDVNDELPKFNQTVYTASLKEGSQTNVSVYATDPDKYNALVYSICGYSALDENNNKVNTSKVKEWFTIDGNTGMLSVSSETDRETAKKITLTILVNDTKAVLRKPQTDEAKVEITLLDVNDNPPTFTYDSYNASVSENARAGTQILTVSATDADENRTITYSLRPGASPTDSFDIDPNTGTISKEREVDREQNETIELTVVATDNGVPQKNSTADVLVTIVDFNDNGPVFVNSVQEHYMEEGCPNITSGDPVIDINATDADVGPNKNITYFLAEDNVQKTNFSINITSGVIYLRPNCCLDREEMSVHLLTITAKDNPENKNLQKSNTTTVKIYVNDTNDNAPQFKPDNYNKRITESTKVGDEVFQVTALDKDAPNSENSKISFTLINGTFQTYKHSNISESCTNKFNITNDTGKIKVNSSLIDCVGNYTLTILATDSGTPPLNGSTNVWVMVDDVNLHKPEIHNIPDKGILSVYECTRVNTTIHQFNYSDADYGENAEVNFKIISGNDDNTFDLTVDGTLILRRNLSADVKSTYTFQMQAKDHGIPQQKSDKETIIVKVVDVNNYLPGFNTTERPAFGVKENLPNNTEVPVGKVSAYDQDQDSKTCYSIANSTWSGSFRVNETTGTIFNTQSLDRENVSTLNLTIVVRDCTGSLSVNESCGNLIMRNPNAKQDTVVMLNILDLNDNPPVFVNHEFSVGMKQDTTPGTALELDLKSPAYTRDNDTYPNGQLAWLFSNNGTINVSNELIDANIKSDSGAENCTDGVKHIFCITPNGTLISNRYFNEDLYGIVTVPVRVSDKAGADTAIIKVYLISSSQIITIVVRQPKDKVDEMKDELLKALSEVIGKHFVFDGLQNHIIPQTGQVDILSTDLRCHVEDPVTKLVLSASEAESAVDKAAGSPKLNSVLNKFNIAQVKALKSEELQTDEKQSKIFILIAVSVAEGLIICIIIYAAFSSRSKLKTKLRAANIKTYEMDVIQEEAAVIPGSNKFATTSNPLLNANVPEMEVRLPDTHSLSSEPDYADVDLDDNEVDAAQLDTLYDRMEEKEVTMDLYNDDSRGSMSSEDLLGAALQLHDLRKSTEMLDQLEEGPSTSAKRTGDQPSLMGVQRFNDAFDDLESTEI